MDVELSKYLHVTKSATCPHLSSGTQVVLLNVKTKPGPYVWLYTRLDGLIDFSKSAPKIRYICVGLGSQSHQSSES